MSLLKRYRSSLLLLITAFVMLGIALADGQNTLNKKQEDPIPFADLRTLTEIFGRIKSNYVEEVTDKTILENAIRGMLSGLDPHSSYLDIEEYKELQEATTGKFGGLGIEVTMEEGVVKVITPIDDTPAQRAGVQAGDLIIRLGDKPVKNMTLNEAVDLMRGKPGTSIELMIVREGVEYPFVVSLERDVIDARSVRNRVLEQNYAYIRISNFQDDTGEELIEAIEQIKKQNKSGLKGLVLDLRNNPGGVLSSAVEVCDAFLDAGLIVYTKGRTEDAGQDFKADDAKAVGRQVIPNDLVAGVPMVVLVNEGSASASEIVAGAIQDHKRGVIMGEQTFGKGSVQSVLPLPSGAAIKLTTARYYTPKGRSIQAEGIKPDIVLKKVKLGEVENKPDAFDPLKEANLTRHLTKPGETPATATNKDKKLEAKQKAAEEELMAKDYELFEALNLLKALTVLDKKG